MVLYHRLVHCVKTCWSATLRSTHSLYVCYSSIDKTIISSFSGELSTVSPQTWRSNSLFHLWIFRLRCPEGSLPKVWIVRFLIQVAVLSRRTPPDNLPQCGGPLECRTLLRPFPRRGRGLRAERCRVCVFASRPRGREHHGQRHCAFCVVTASECGRQEVRPSRKRTNESRASHPDVKSRHLT